LKKHRALFIKELGVLRIMLACAKEVLDFLDDMLGVKTYMLAVSKIKLAVAKKQLDFRKEVLSVLFDVLACLTEQIAVTV